jgi:hypothetical protein
LVQNAYGLESQKHSFVAGIAVASFLSLGCLGYFLVK